MHLPERKHLPHDIPPWVPAGAVFFVTINSLPRGQNTLCQPGIAKRVLSAFLFRHSRQEWYLRLLVLMPDHLHALLSVPAEGSMRQLIAQTKHFLAKDAGIAWQRGFFDHRLRREESLFEKAAYVRQNPVRQGLVAKPDDWQYVWSNEDASLPSFGFR